MEGLGGSIRQEQTKGYLSFANNYPFKNTPYTDQSVLSISDYCALGAAHSYGNKDSKQNDNIDSVLVFNSSHKNIKYTSINNKLI